jgi:hypothetical protein
VNQSGWRGPLVQQSCHSYTTSLSKLSNSRRNWCHYFNLVLKKKNKYRTSEHRLSLIIKHERLAN